MRRDRFVRLGETARAAIRLTIDGRPCSALDGDTLLTALLCNGRRVRACTTPVTDGMNIVTRAPDSSWPKP